MAATENRGYVAPPDPSDEDLLPLQTRLFEDPTVGTYARAWNERDEWGWKEALRRFYLARRGQLDAAFRMLADALAWRQSYGTDRMLTDADYEDMPNFALLRAYWPARFIGRDKRGFPIYVERFGHVDPATLLGLVPGPGMTLFSFSFYFYFLFRVGCYRVQGSSRRSGEDHSC
jgi:hypothetical protein